MIFNNKVIDTTQPFGVESGGGLWFAGTGAKRVVNCLVAHNNNDGYDGVHGGGIEVESDGFGDGTVEIRNSTIAHNGPAELGGGVDTKGVPVLIYDSIIWGNQATTGRQIRVAASGTIIDPRYSDIQRLDSNDVATNTPAPNYISCIGTSSSDDPKFINPTTPPYDYALSNSQPNPSKCIDAGSNVIMAADIVNLDGDTSVTEKVPLEVERLARRFDDPTVTDTGITDPIENPPVSAIVDMGAFEAPRCSLTSCNDRDWCTHDSCSNNTCSNECVDRCYGNVNYSNPEQVTLDDILAVMACFQGNCANCGPNGTGTLSGCDIRNGSGCPSLCGSDAVVDMNDILAALAAFSNCSICPSCCGGEGLLAGDGGGGIGNLGVAEEIIKYLASAQSSESESDGTHQILAEAFTTFVSTEYSQEEKATVIEMLQNAQAGAEGSLAIDLLAQIAEKIAE